MLSERSDANVYLIYQSSSVGCLLCILFACTKSGDPQGSDARPESEDGGNMRKQGKEAMHRITRGGSVGGATRDHQGISGGPADGYHS